MATKREILRKEYESAQRGLLALRYRQEKDMTEVYYRLLAHVRDGYPELRKDPEKFLAALRISQSQAIYEDLLAIIEENLRIAMELGIAPYEKLEKK